MGYEGMTTFRSENVLVGLIAGALVPWISLRLIRGLRDGRLPLGRNYVSRDERAGAFRALFAFYVASAVAALFISVDLLFGMRPWS
jgi:hypothetical protein